MSLRYINRKRTQDDDFLEKKQVCKSCNTNNRNNPGMILKINTCGHSYCDQCVNSIFRKGEEACCVDVGDGAVCGIRLKLAKFRKRQFKDETLDKEMWFRKLIEDAYNKQQNEFESVIAYNQYVEDKETKIYELTYGDRSKIKILLKEIDEFKRENSKTIRKNQEELNRKKREWKIEVDKIKEYDEFIAKKFRDEDQAKISKNSVSKHDVDLINKIEQQAQADVKEIVKFHQQEHQMKLDTEEKLKKETEDRLKQEQNHVGQQIMTDDVTTMGQTRGNKRGFLNRKKFDFEMESRKIEEPWDYKYNCSFLPRKKDGYPWLRTKEDIKYAGYDKLIPVTETLKEWAGSIHIDKTSIAQRQVNDAMACL